MLKCCQNMTNKLKKRFIYQFVICVCVCLFFAEFILWRNNTIPTKITKIKTILLLNSWVASTEANRYSKCPEQDPQSDLSDSLIPSSYKWVKAIHLWKGSTVHAVQYGRSKYLFHRHESRRTITAIFASRVSWLFMYILQELHSFIIHSLLWKQFNSVMCLYECQYPHHW